MKNILYIIAIIFCFSANAQETVTVDLRDTPPEYTTGQVIYYKDMNNILGRYTGNWIYDDGIHYLKITISKNLHVPSLRNLMYNDELSIKFRYIKDGVTIYDTYGLTPRYISGNGVAHKIISDMVHFTDNLSLTYSEPPTNGSCSRVRVANLTLEYLNALGSPAQLKWTRKDYTMERSDYNCPDGTVMDTSENLIPENMILTKE